MVDTPKDRLPSPMLSMSLSLSTAVLFCFLMFRFSFLTDVLGYDTFWHLASGLLTLESEIFPSIDPFSFSAPHSPWMNTNWFAQVALFKLFSIGGFPFLRLFTAFFFIFTVVFYLLSCKALKANNLGTMVGLVFLILSLLPVDSVRPRLISYAFLALLWSLLLLNPKSSKLILVFVSSLFIFWVQLHGGVVYGGLLVLGWSFGRLIDNKLSQRTILTKDITSFLSAGALGLAGFLFHPQGFLAFEHLLFYPIRLGNQLGEIAELTPPAYGSFAWILIVVMTLALFPICRLLAKEVRWAYIVPLVMFALFSFKMARGLPSFAILLSPFIASSLKHYGSRIDNYLAWFKPALTLLAVSLLVVWAAVAYSSRQAFVRDPLPIEHSLIDRARFPVDAALFIRSKFSGKKVFNYYRHGGYLNWAFFKQNLTYIDGRGDHHERTGTYSNYLDIVDLKPGWENQLQTTGADLILYPKTHAFAAAAQDTGMWIPIYTDDYNVVLALKSDK